MNGNTESQRASTRRKSGSATRRLFFLMTALWGYLLGGAGMYIFCCRDGAAVDPDIFTVSLLVVSVVLAVCGALIFHRTYREYRKRKSRI